MTNSEARKRHEEAKYLNLSGSDIWEAAYRWAKGYRNMTDEEAGDHANAVIAKMLAK